MAKSKLYVQGMSCEHCSRAVRRAIESVEGVESVEVDLKKGEVAVGHSVAADLWQAVTAVQEEGFEAQIERQEP